MPTLWNARTGVEVMVSERVAQRLTGVGWNRSVGAQNETPVTSTRAGAGDAADGQGAAAAGTPDASAAAKGTAKGAAERKPSPSRPKRGRPPKSRD